MPEIRFGMQDAEHRSLPVSAQQMINCYLESAVPGSRTQAPVIAAYGIESFASINNPKGANSINGNLYVQDVTTLYRVDWLGNITALGSISAGSDAIIEGDGVNVVIVTDDKGYIYDGSIAQITDTDFPIPQWMGYVDGYFPIIEKGSGRFWINETPYVPADWNALDFATAEGAPDDLVWGLVEKRELILFGRDSTEVWYNSGDTDFPFQRTANGFFETGIMSRWAAGKLAEGVFFMGNDGIAYQLNGYTPTRISNHAIEQQIEGYTRECRCLTWKEAGHAMVGFNFPEACHVFDLSTQLWHKRRSYTHDNWHNNFIVHAFGKYITGGPSVGTMNAYTFTEYGDILRAQCTSATVNQKNDLIPHDMLELNFDTGHEGMVMLRYSDDGGHTWSREQTENLGSIGEYETRVRFNRLGASRDRVYEYAISDPYRRTLINAYLNEFG